MDAPADRWVRYQDAGGRVRNRPAPNDKNRALDALEVSRFTGKSDGEPSSPDFLTSAAGDAYDVRPQVHLHTHPPCRFLEAASAHDPAHCFLPAALGSLSK
jgi:hypothetical protein